MSVNPHSQRGFTLIELVVVMILMGISVALVAPTIADSVERAQFRKDVRVVSSMLTLARSQAIAHKTPYSCFLDLNEHVVRVAPYQKETSKTDTIPVAQLSLPHTNVLRVTTRKREQSSGIGTLDFYPNGSSSGGTISMEGKGQKESFHLTVNIVTGLASSKTEPE